MKINVIACYQRFAVIEIEDGGYFGTLSPCEIFINGSLFCSTGKCVNYIGGLKPDSIYNIEVKSGSEKASVTVVTRREYVTLDVKKFGAAGDGVHDDTVNIQSAIMACPPDSRVLIPKGTYKVTSLFLKSNVMIELAKDSAIIADSSRSARPVLPGMIQSYDETEEYNLGTWEGNPLQMFAGIITGIDVTGAVIYGEGVIDGGASFDNWWKNPKEIRSAYRPRLLYFNRCKDISLYGLSLRNSPSWTVHPYFSENVTVCGINITNPENSPNTDGIDIESCRNVKITGTEFSLGDDCIAVKSGKIYMGRKYRTPSENIRITRCLMQNGHGAVTLGSEMSAGVKQLTVEKCSFKNTDRGLRIKTRRGRGELCTVENIIFRDIVMDGVKTPFTVNSFYFCDPDGRTSYVQNREALPVDERTPFIDRLTFENCRCKNCHAAAAFFMGLPERKISRITMKNIEIDFAENAEPSVPAMLCGVDAAARRGIIAENIKELILEKVSITGYEGDLLDIKNVDSIRGEYKCGLD